MSECVQHAMYLVHVQKTLVSISLLLSLFLLLNDQILTRWQSGPCFLWGSHFHLESLWTSIV